MLFVWMMATYICTNGKEGIPLASSTLTLSHGLQTVLSRWFASWHHNVNSLLRVKASNVIKCKVLVSKFIVSFIKSLRWHMYKLSAHYFYNICTCPYQHIDHRRNVHKAYTRRMMHDQHSVGIWSASVWHCGLFWVVVVCVAAVPTVVAAAVSVPERHAVLVQLQPTGGSHGASDGTRYTWRCLHRSNRLEGICKIYR